MSATVGAPPANRVARGGGDGEQPELPFRLGGVHEKDLLACIDDSLPAAKPASSGKVLETDVLSAMFSLDMAAGGKPPASAARRRTTRRPLISSLTRMRER